MIMEYWPLFLGAIAGTIIGITNNPISRRLMADDKLGETLN